MKTVIQVFTQKIVKDRNFKDTSGYWGLGDLIRGTIHLYQLSKKLNFRLIVDYQLHPISEFLKGCNHEYSELIKSNKDNILFVDQCGSEKHIINNKNDVIYFLTNDFYNDELNEDDKNFIKTILEPNELFNNEINMLKNKFDKFDIFHFRLGDIEKSKMINTDYNIFIKMLQNIKNNGANNLLITDSETFKKEIKLKTNNIITLDTKIIHLGYNTDSNKIKDTLLEFYIMRYASIIYTYSIFTHNNGISGFVYYINKIYNIPIKRIAYDYEEKINNKNIISKFIKFNEFDWKKYISNYTDLKGFKTKEQAWNHFIKFGINEERSYF